MPSAPAPPLKTFPSKRVPVELEGDCFTGCFALDNMDMMENVEKMGQGMFSACLFGPQFVIKSFMKNIPMGTFSACNNLKCVIIEDGVESIGEKAFGDCSGLQVIIIPPSVTDIHPHAFMNTLNFIILGEKGSRAESFAQEKYIRFDDVNDVRGDVDGNFIVDISDALYALQAQVGSRILDDKAFNAADIDKDGKITVSDALYILQYTVGMRQTLRF